MDAANRADRAEELLLMSIARFLMIVALLNLAFLFSEFTLNVLGVLIVAFQ